MLQASLAHQRIKHDRDFSLVASLRPKDSIDTKDRCLKNSMVAKHGQAIFFLIMTTQGSGYLAHSQRRLYSTLSTYGHSFYKVNKKYLQSTHFTFPGFSKEETNLKRLRSPSPYISASIVQNRIVHLTSGKCCF